MKKLVIYYSLEGNTKIIAETIANEMGADTMELKPKKEISKKGFSKYLWGGKQVIMKETPELTLIDKDISEYDLLIIGTPVWGCNFAPPIRTLFSNKEIVNKTIALFCTHDGGPGKIINRMKEAILDNNFISEMFFEKVSSNTDYNIKKAKKWAQDLEKNV